MQCISGLVGVGLLTLVAAACGSSTKEFDGPNGGRAGKGGASGSAGRGGSGGSGSTGTGATGGSGAVTTGGTGGGGTAGGTENTAAGVSGDDGSGGDTQAGSGGTGNGGTSGRAGGGAGGRAQGGRGGNAQAGAPTGGVDINDAPAEVAVDLCDKIYDCCTAQEIMNIDGIGTSKGQCQLAVAVFVQLQVASVKPAIEAGRVVYDGTALDRCLTDYGDQSCSMLRGIESFECEGLMVPQQAVGDPCGVSSECIDGYCEGGGSAQTPNGECVALKANGSDCAENAECQSNFCDTTCAEPSSSALCGG